MTIIDIELPVCGFNPAQAISHPLRLVDARFGIAVSYDTETQKFSEWLPEDLFTLWCYLLTTTVVGWNVSHYEIPVIRRNLPLAYVIPKKTPLVEDLFGGLREETLLAYGASETVAWMPDNTEQISALLSEFERTGDRKYRRSAFDLCREHVEIELSLYQAISRQEEIFIPPVEGSIKFQYQQENITQCEP